MRVEDDLVFIGIKALRVNASVANDIAVGFRDVASSATQVSVLGAAIHQVLRTQRNKCTSALLQLALESSQRAEGPA